MPELIVTPGTSSSNLVSHKGIRPSCDPDALVWWRYLALVRLGDTPATDCASIMPLGYEVVRETEASVWVDVYGHHRRIGRDWGRKWAYPTIEEAWAGWRRRFRWRQKFHAMEARRIETLKELLNNEGTQQ